MFYWKWDIAGFQSLAILREQSTSTWLSVTAKGVNLEEFIDFQTPINLNEDFEPVCPELLSSSPLLTLDHLPAYHLRHQFIYYKPEKGLTDASFKFLSGRNWGISINNLSIGYVYIINSSLKAT